MFGETCWCLLELIKAPLKCFFMLLANPLELLGKKLILTRATSTLLGLRSMKKCAIKRYVTADCWHSFKELSPTWVCHLLVRKLCHNECKTLIDKNVARVWSYQEALLCSKTSTCEFCLKSSSSLREKLTSLSWTSLIGLIELMSRPEPN